MAAKLNPIILVKILARLKPPSIINLDWLLSTGADIIPT
jgi:hypothetical protein